MRRCLSELGRARRELKSLRQEPEPRGADAGEPRGAGKENRSPPADEQRTLQQTVADVTRVSVLGKARVAGSNPGGGAGFMSWCVDFGGVSLRVEEWLIVERVSGS